MGLLSSTENYELTVPLDYDDALTLVIRAADASGRVKDTNTALGIVTFVTGATFVFGANPVRFSVNVVRQSENQTLLRMALNCFDGILGANSCNRAYTAFCKLLTKGLKA